MASDKTERKSQRRKVLKDGKLVSHQLHGGIDVRIRDLSLTGARLELPFATVIPEPFELLVVTESKLYPAKISWRRGDRIGLEFTGPPKSASLRKW